MKKKQSKEALRPGLSGPLKLNDHAPAEEVKKKRRPEEIIAQVMDEGEATSVNGQPKTPPKTILINFNNVAVIEYIRFISRLTNRNFIFDETDLQFNVTIISEEPTTVDNVLTALVQELRIHGLRLIEEGNNFIIHQSENGGAISRINTDESLSDIPKNSELVTQVFRLNTLSPVEAQSILTPLLSKQALMGIAPETRHIIITDLVSNIQKVEKLLKSIDAPSSGLVLGQYVVRNAFMDNLIELAAQIMGPIAQDQKLSLIPHPAAKSIFIVSSPFIVERTISVLQHLDNFQGTTRIYDLEDLKFQMFQPKTPTKPAQETETLQQGPAETGKWELNTDGNRLFRPGFPQGSTGSPNELPIGDWLLDPQNNWYFSPKGTQAPFNGERNVDYVPKGQWLLDSQGAWIFQLSPGEMIKPERLVRGIKADEALPLGHIDRTKFFINKLEFRRGDDIVKALQSIAQSLLKQGNSNQDLIATIESAQWLEASNSIIITGIDSTIEKVRELIEEIDQPQRQVMIEMLILDTTINDSLTYGVSWGTRSGGGSTSTSQAFVGGGSPLVAALGTAGITNGLASTPDASNVATTIGYTLGMIGRRLTHDGTQFASIGALVSAIHTMSDTNIILNPKIITEDNKPAEIFVGVNSPFLSNSIANDQGSIVTTNVEFKDTGTTLQVTPLIGHGNIITLEIKQEVSNVQSTPSSGGGQTSTVNLTPTTSIERTSTTVHVPDKCFVVISGMIQEQKVTNNNQFPCLGGIPVLGSAFKTTSHDNSKRNLMIFIWAEIIDTNDQFRDLTKRQQQIYKQKNRIKKSWKYEVDQALDFMNIGKDCCECD